MFVQHLAAEAHNMAKLERKPRRNVQYKDMASAVLHHDNLEFLVDVVPKTAPYKQVKAQVAASRAKLNAGPAAAAAASRSDGRAEDPEAAADMPTGKRSKSKASPRRPSLAALNGTPAGGESPVAIMVNGTSHPVEGPRAPGNSRQSVHVLGDDEPNALSHTESRQAHHDDGDVDMTG